MRSFNYEFRNPIHLELTRSVALELQTRLTFIVVTTRFKGNRFNSISCSGWENHLAIGADVNIIGWHRLLLRRSWCVFQGKAILDTLVFQVHVCTRGLPEVLHMWSNRIQNQRKVRNLKQYFLYSLNLSLRLNYPVRWYKFCISHSPFIHGVTSVSPSSTSSANVEIILIAPAPRRLCLTWSWLVFGR